MSRKLQPDGFAFMDMLVTLTFLLAMILIFLPIIQYTRDEHHLLSTRSQMMTELYNEMLNDQEEYPIYKQVKINHTPASIEINLADSSASGCITWENIKRKQESKCIYVKKGF
ncbi:hypothetical protein [Salinibacillus aidingensis]